MTPDAFLQRIAKQPPAPVYLFAGPEAYARARCRAALVERVLAPEDRAEGVSHVDLSETTLPAVIDDARSLSLFARDRVMWVSSAETALPKRMGSGEDGDASVVADYLRHPTPGTVLVFESSRFGFEGEDKARIDRLLKFYSAIPDVVEFRPYAPEAARRLARELAAAAGLNIGSAELGMLVEVLASDAARIATEVEKLALYAGSRKITSEDIALMVPNARETTIFALVAALGRGDRERSLEHLDLLLKEGEYLPLALTFLATQFRLALAAQEANLRSAQQIQTYFTRQGVRIWRDRAEQVSQTVTAFPQGRLRRAIGKVYEADKALRDTRPDDRVVMESLILELT